MTGFVAILIVVLLTVVIVQIGKVSELAAKIRGEEETNRQRNDRTAFWLVVFMVVFLIACVASAIYYKNVMLGYGPLTAASAHGVTVDGIFNITLFFTGIVFVITHILLFWYSYKYREKEGQKAMFYAHNNTLELIWTIIPAIVMTFLVANGLAAWNEIMPDVDPDEQYLEIEATGYQFAWDIRYPGPDNKLGTRDYLLIDPASNTLGQDWTDDKNIDDVVLGGANKIVLPVDTIVRVRITAKDVLHNFYLPHFRVKMDAVPGLPTYFIFTPTKTTKEFRQQLKEYPEWREPYDPTDPDSKERWEEFNYELACAELCGSGHYSMKRILEVVTKEEYAEWAASQKSFYMQNIRNTDADPNKDKLLTVEIEDRARVLKDDFQKAITSDNSEDQVIRLDHIFFETGSANLDPRSEYELENLVSLLKDNSNLSVEISGHTDNTGDPDTNQTLSESRAAAVLNHMVSEGLDTSKLSSIGYGETQPVDSNDTEEGRKNNRRTELRIISK